MAECPKQKHEEVILAIKDLQDNKEDKGVCLQAPSQKSLYVTITAIMLLFGILSAALGVWAGQFTKKEESQGRDKLIASNEKEIVMIRRDIEKLKEINDKLDKIFKAVKGREK